MLASALQPVITTGCVYNDYCIFTSVSGFGSDDPKIRHCRGRITHCIQYRLQEPISESQTSQEGGCKARCYDKR